MEFVGFAFVAVFAVLLYMLPAFVAAGRRCKAEAGIAIVNIFLGWTFIGWVVALAWAAVGEVKPALATIKQA